MIMEMSSVGRPRAVSTRSIVTSPALGTDAAPIDAAVAVNDTIMICPKLKSTAFICAIKIAATASYSAVPSMFTVAPTGSTNLVTCKQTKKTDKKKDKKNFFKIK